MVGQRHCPGRADKEWVDEISRLAAVFSEGSDVDGGDGAQPKPATTFRRRAACRARPKLQVDLWMETGRLRLSKPWPPGPAGESFPGRNGCEDGLVGDHLDFVTREITHPPWLLDSMLRIDKQMRSRPETPDGRWGCSDSRRKHRLLPKGKLILVCQQEFSYAARGKVKVVRIVQPREVAVAFQKATARDTYMK